jgi:SulP family sulfate permease
MSHTAKTQLSSLAAAGMVLITLVALMPLFHNLPEAVLGAIVIYAVARMMKVNELRRFYQFHVDEFAQAMLALFGVILVGILPGLAIAIVLSLLRFIWGASYLSVTRLVHLKTKLTRGLMRCISAASVGDQLIQKPFRCD